MAETIEEKAEGIKFSIRQVFGIGSDGRMVIIPPSIFEKIVSWPGEMVVNSQSEYLYTCPSCRTQTQGNLDNLTKDNEQVLCGGCLKGFDAYAFIGKGPRAYLIKEDNK